MSKYDKKYDPLKIFEEVRETLTDVKAVLAREAEALSAGGRQVEIFYEIEYDNSPIPGAGKFVLKSQKITPPVKDEVREIFDRMRDIARKKRSYAMHNSGFYDRRVQQENAGIFYEQGMFMKDFEDHYGKSVPCSTYFPNYQMMGYEQLRTYFTWRSEVRKGNVEETSLSYAFLYIYELLGNIGVESPEEGLSKLMFFWKEYRVFEKNIDKYVLRWLKDYHIYYELPHTFKEFIEENALTEQYPGVSDTLDDFDMFCAVSKYDIRKSVFYTEDRKQLIKDCFQYVMERLKELFGQNNMDFLATVFQPVKNMAIWTPFKDALFYPWLKQDDRRVVISEKEIYSCVENRWTFNTALTTDSGRQLLGYVMKQMEATLRELTKFKYTITAGIGMVDHVLMARLDFLGISLEKVVTEAVREFYKEATITVVKVDRAALERIRQEALVTQEKLIVPEEEATIGVPPVGVLQSEASTLERQADEGAAEVQSASVQPQLTPTQPHPAPDENAPWHQLRQALTTPEKSALSTALNTPESHRLKAIRELADAHALMQEVLLDSINEKAMDFVGDSLLDEEFAIYEDYIEQVKEMMENE